MIDVLAGPPVTLGASSPTFSPSKAEKISNSMKVAVASCGILLVVIVPAVGWMKERVKVPSTAWFGSSCWISTWAADPFVIVENVPALVGPIRNYC